MFDLSTPHALLPSTDHAPSFYAATTQDALKGQGLSGDLRCDVCVVGGGYTGLSTALHLAKRGVDVAVLEQSRIGWGASGRNGGQIHVGLRQDVDWLEANVGAIRAQKLWQFAIAARDHLDWLLQTYAIDCDLQDGLIHADHRARFGRQTKRHVEKLRDKYNYSHIRYLDTEELRDIVNSSSYYGGTYDTRGGHLHPLKYALGIARGAVSHGARLYEGCHVKRVEAKSGQWKITTTDGVVTANRVVYACNGYMYKLDDRVERRVMPINNYIAVTERLEHSRALSLISNGAAVSDSRFVVNYFRITADDRLLFGGGENYRYRFPRDIAAFVRPHMLAVYPQLKDVTLDYAWGGTLGITPTRMPFVAELERGLYSASGFSGLGVVLAPFVGKAVADALCGDREHFELLSGVTVPAFPGGSRLRWPTLVAGMFYYALRDVL